MIHEQRTFTEWDACRQALGSWDLSGFVFTDRNRHFRAIMDSVQGDAFFLLRARFNRSLFHSGASPSGFRTFAFLNTASAPVKFRQGDLKNGIARVTGNEIEGVSNAGCDMLIIGLSEALVAWRAPGASGVFDESNSMGVVRSSAAALAALRGLVCQVFDAAATDSAQLMDDQAVADMLADGLESAAQCGEPPAPIPSTTARRRALKRSLEFIDDHVQDDLRIGDICRYAAASERTLEYAFREYCGVTPKSFLSARRLHAFREALKSRAGDLVADVASEFDFWHMGKLAGDYRAMFGELPSQTLKRQALASYPVWDFWRAHGSSSLATKSA